MKQHVPFLDTGAMPWTEGEFPGLSTKMLSTDPASGARTALQCIDPTRGYRPPTVAHFHPSDEELLVLRGRFSFDGETWLSRGSYCFHPADTVHGFKSQVTEPSWFLSRVTQDLSFGFEENPERLEPYPRSGHAARRGIAVLADPVGQGWQPCELAAFAGADQRVLSLHPDTGEGSLLIRLPAGWTAPTSAPGPHYLELYVMDGGFRAADGREFRAGCYAFLPPGTDLPGGTSATGALLYVNLGGWFPPASP